MYLKIGAGLGCSFDSGYQEITIHYNNDKPVAKISPFPRPLKRGSAKGKVWMSDDFDEPLEDFKEYM